MADGLDLFGAGGGEHLPHQGLTAFAVGAGDADLDQFVIGQRAFQFRGHALAEPLVSQGDHRGQSVTDPA